MSKWLFLVVLFVLGNFGFSQQLSGTVSDAFGTPLYNVYVYNETSKTHTHTNDLGEFTISNTTENQILKFSLLGFKSKSVIIQSGSETITITLEDETIQLSELTLTTDLDINSTLSRIDLTLNPVASSQEILKVVPGLFIGQHAGGGKAEQIFLRGFDIDHGTDIALSADGIPVNMVSHAHGQGYSDLHFIIPETIDAIDFDKGPYQFNQGNFATAGYVNFKTKSKFNENKISVEAGQFNTLRTFGAFSILPASKKSSAYIASEYIITDGPFEASQNFNRFNIFSKFNTNLSNDYKLTVLVSHFKSRWDASGQIPERLVNNGTISRFGAVDSTEGGFTSRSNIGLNLTKYLDENASVKTNLYFSKYDFTLYSNFTFFLNDPINGDQIKQKEDRYLYGFNTDYSKKYFLNNYDVTVHSGVGLKVNTVFNNELSSTKNRTETVNRIQYGDVDETNFFGYYGANFKLHHFSIQPSVRLEYFKFSYLDKLATTYSNQSVSKLKALPKLNLSYSHNPNSVYFFKTGLGFHSNDSRVVLQEDKEILPSVLGMDLGTILKLNNNIVLTTALWSLFSDQEFVYVGDAGIVEPSGKSSRYGVDLGIKYQLSDYLFLNFDANYAHARSTDASAGANYIPLAPNFTSVGSLSLKNYKRFSATLNYKYIADRPADETNTVVADGYFVSDFAMDYKWDSNFNIGLSVVNLFNTKWKETQFLTESRLQNESQPVEEIHFTPGSPFFAKLKLTYTF